MRRDELPGSAADGPRDSVPGRAFAVQTHATPLLSAALLSDAGRERRLAVNEDSALVLEARGGGLFAVADGMGGHAAGEVASRLAVETLREAYMLGRSSAPQRLAAAVQAAGAAVHRRATGDEAGMGTTLTALVIDGGAALVANVGDSRAYLWRAGQLTHLTRDHSWVAEQVRHGLLSAREARAHQWRNVVSNALGSEERVRLDLLGAALERGDRLLLCSDGLTDVLDDPEIAELLGREAEPAALATDLVAAANAAGGPDNITVLVIELRSDAARPRYALPAWHQDGPLDADSIRPVSRRRGALTQVMLGVLYLALLGMIVFPERRVLIAALSVLALSALLLALRPPRPFARRAAPPNAHSHQDYQEVNE